MTGTDVRSPTISDTHQAICEEIQRLLDVRSDRAAAYGPQFVELWELAAQCVTGGKLLRPRLLMGGFEALAPSASPKDAAAALKLAAALEVLHFAFLLHDDVIDEDLRRRGEPNLIGHLVQRASAEQCADAAGSVASARRTHWAQSSGLLIGDLMLTIAHQVFARVQLPEPQRIRVLDLLDAAVTETVAGEYCDVGFADGCIAPDLSLVLEMTRMKTATYTFELPLRIASVVAGADSRVEQKVGNVGRHLGVAFQLQDDLLSAFETSDTHGKDQFSDFREGKETALIAYARMTYAWPSFEQLLGAPDFSEASGRTIQRLLEECGARSFIESMVQDQIRTALEILTQNEAVMPPALSRFILTLVDSLDGRRA